MCKKLIFLTSFVLVLALASTNVAFGQTVWEGRISSAGDDLEESVSSGGYDATSSDLEITEEGSPGSNQLIGLRFNGVAVPQGATITNAYVQFHVDETGVPGDNRPGTKFLRGEAVDNATPFSTAAPFNISSRPTTSAEASWDWPFWLTTHEEGPDQRTSDISAVIQEIVDRPGWAPGNSLVLIITGSGENCAEAYDGEPEGAALLHIEYTLGNAAAPNPADGAIDVPRDVVLSWKPGIFAAPVNGHKFYMSENFNDVNDGIGGITQSDSSYTPPQRLDFSTTYYWRVDELSGPPDNTVYEGSVWRFTTELLAYPIDGNNITATASSAHQAEMGPEKTIDGSGLDENDLHSNEETDMWLSGSEPLGAWIEYQFDKVYKLHQMWVWNSNQVIESLIGFGAKDVTVEYSSNGIDYKTLGTPVEFARAPGAPNYAHNTTIDFGGAAAKYVRLTVTSNWGGIMPQYGLGEVRFLYIPVSATQPYPDSEATGVDRNVVLSWRAGREAVTHDVYISTDEQAVVDRTAAVATVTENSYGPLSLDLDVTHYWRVDEVNGAETTTTWESNIWSFTVVDHIVVDDFESYNDLDPEDPASKRIFNVWLDGYEVPTNGSLVGYETPPFCERATVHGGVQSMPLFYDNTAGATYSEAEVTLSPPQDWSKHGVKAFSLWFYGDPNNTAEQLYVKFNDYKVVYDGDASDITKTKWQQWNIDLASLGLNLQNVTKLAIGIDGNGASGKLLFDDILLYPPRCLPNIRKPQGDVNNDCVVDYLDLEIMAAGWLETDSAMPAVAPSPAELVLHYKLDGNASDSSGNNNHGIERAGPTYVAGKFGQAISLDGSNDYVAIQNFNYQSVADLTGATVAAWIRTSVSSNQIIATFDRNEYWRLQIAGEAGGPGLVGWEVYTSTGQVDTDQATNWPANTGRVDDGEWHHVAGVFDNGTLTIYIDGIAKEPYSGGPTFGRGRAVRYGYLGVGSESTSFDAEPRTPANFFDGDLDEVYIYHRALTPAEIAYLADETPGDGELYVPVPSVANMSNEEPALSRSVNIKDYALLADWWLDEQLWPQP